MNLQKSRSKILSENKISMNFWISSKGERDCYKRYRFIVDNFDHDKLNDKVAYAEEKLQREINFIIYEPHEFQEKIQMNDGFISDILTN